MKLLHILRWLVLLLSALLALQLMTGSATSPRGTVDELFDRYSGQEGVRLAVIHGMPVNDTLNKDILMLTATDSAGWAWILTEFTNIEEGSPLFNAAMTSTWFMCSHAGTKEKPGERPPLSEGTTYYDQLEQGVYDELLRVFVTASSRSTLIVAITNRQEGQALIDMIWDRNEFSITPEEARQLKNKPI